jgi:periplasmic protein CpxP/Spy
MKRQFLTLTALTALATGLVFAQPPAAPQSPKAQTGRHEGVRRHRERMAQALNLTDAQKAQAKTIFQQAREASKPVREELKQNRLALSTAAKEGKSDADIQRLAERNGRLMAKVTAIRTEAFEKFYGTLNPEQRTKLDQMQKQFHARAERFRHHDRNSKTAS